MILITTKPSSLVMSFFYEDHFLFTQTSPEETHQVWPIPFDIPVDVSTHLSPIVTAPVIPSATHPPLHQLRSLGDPLDRPSHLHTCVISISNRLYRLVPLNHLNQR